MSLICDGVRLVGRYGNAACGTWLLENNGEVAIVETPGKCLQGRSPWDDSLSYVNHLGLNPKWIFITHPHTDHITGYHHYRQNFPTAKSLVHRTFKQIRFISLQEYTWEQNNEDTFNSDYTIVDLGGEPLFLIHAPKHSEQDTLIIFRGVVITGDWVIGPYDEERIDQAEVIYNLKRVRSILKNHNYKVHTLLSAHANEARGNIDFDEILDEMIEHLTWTPRKVFAKVASL
jgi:glyoxylase-like metal-dependent hydrolase (beta-lactamase superfamily II)